MSGARADNPAGIGGFVGSTAALTWMLLHV
jgi:hypothetical protein